MPTGVTHYPIAVLVHGSGQLDKDETIYDNKPFAELAHGLARHGIATLRYDKRTLVYHSQQGFTIRQETVDDALSAIRVARSQCPHDKVFLIGHSLGAMVAPWIASECQELGGIVMMAAPARRLSDVIAEQTDYLLPSGASQEYKNEQIAAIKARSPQYFEGELADYGQVGTAQSLSMPILILQGERDYQVRMTDFRIWQQALEGRDNVDLHSYPGLNHLFHESHSAGELSNPSEYLTAGTIPELVIDDIARFIHHASSK